MPDKLPIQRDLATTQRQLRNYLMRRRAVLGGGLAGAAALALPGAGRLAMAQDKPPLSFVGWQYNPQIVEENVNIFRELYDENVNYELVPGEYHAVVETKLIGGQKIDMMYSEEDRLVRCLPIRLTPIPARSSVGHGCLGS